MNMFSFHLFLICFPDGEMLINGHADVYVHENSQKFKENQMKTKQTQRTSHRGGRGNADAHVHESK